MKAFLLALLLVSSLTHAGFIDDVFASVNGFFSGVTTVLLGVPKPDAESVCVEKTIEYYQPELGSTGVITDQLAFSAYDLFNSCKSSVDVNSYSLDCVKKRNLESFCRIVKEKCANSAFVASELRTAQSLGACDTASNLCFSAVTKNYGTCGGKKVRA